MAISQKATEFAGFPVTRYNPAAGIVLPTMPRREFRVKKDQDDLFWAISLEQDRLIIQSGKVGTAGDTKTQVCSSPAEAQNRYCELVTEMTAAGYCRPIVHREFRFVRGEEATFWTIFVSGTQRTIHQGNVGSDGTVSTKQFATTAAALADGEKLIDEKIAEGYVEQKPAAGSLREAIIAALEADPDDHISRMAFADYLNDQGEQLPAVAYRVDEADYGEAGYGTIANLRSFLADPAVGFVEALVVGSCWALADSGQSNSEVVEALIAARDRLTNLRALFLGDIVYRECEISWIHQSDLTDLLAAFPKLEHFRTRGGIDLELRPFEHQCLKSLAFEASNLPREVVVAIGSSRLPTLEHLELWLGTEEYHADTTPPDLSEILQGKRLPTLRYLGLRNSEIVDDIAVALTNAPILKRIRVLDLSLGTLTDRGAEALLANPAVAKLEKLDIHHHYVSPALIERLQALGIEVDASEPQDAEDDGDEGYRFVAHSE